MAVRPVFLKAGSGAGELTGENADESGKGGVDRPSTLVCFPGMVGNVVTCGVCGVVVEVVFEEVA